MKLERERDIGETADIQGVAYTSSSMIHRNAIPSWQEHNNFDGNHAYDIKVQHFSVIFSSKIRIPLIHCGKADVRTIGYLQHNMVSTTNDKILLT